MPFIAPATTTQNITNTTTNNITQTQKETRTGSISLSVLDLTKAITFASAMPSTSYQIFLQPQSSVSAALWPTVKTTAGFTLNVSVGLSATISHSAIEE